MVESYPLSYLHWAWAKIEQLLLEGRSVTLTRELDWVTLTASDPPIERGPDPIEYSAIHTQPSTVETYDTARVRLLSQFQELGFKLRPKTPGGRLWVVLDVEKRLGLLFKQQAIYLDRHSLICDMRWLQARDVLNAVDLRLGTNYAERAQMVCAASDAGR